MKKIILALAIIGFFAVSQVRAQGSIFAIEYSVGFGTGDVKDFVSTVSWRGMSMDYRYFVQPNVGVGFETGYNLFYEEKPYATYTKGTESISGKQYRYLHMVPVLAAVDYYFKPDEQYNPFIGLGIGSLYSYRDVDMGMFTMEDDTWQFAIRPEVGTLITTPGIDFLVALKYNMAFKANDTEAQNYFSVNLGIVF